MSETVGESIPRPHFVSRFSKSKKFVFSSILTVQFIGSVFFHALFIDFFEFWEDFLTLPLKHKPRAVQYERAFQVRVFSIASGSVRGCSGGIFFFEIGIFNVLSSLNTGLKLIGSFFAHAVFNGFVEDESEFALFPGK